MKWFRWLCMLGLPLVPAQTSLVAAEPAQRAITTAEIVLAIYEDDTSPTASPCSVRLIRVIWEDGYTIWSGDRRHGGPPYYAGWIDPKRLRSLLCELDREGLFSQKELLHPHYLDSRFTTVLIRFGDKQMEMGSWHEDAQGDGRVVATATGLTPLAGRRLFEALKAEPAHYLFYRFVWSEIRARAAELVPSVSTPVRGESVRQGRAIFWRPLEPPAKPN